MGAVLELNCADVQILGIVSAMWGAGPDLPGEGEENLIAGGVAISSQSGPSSRPTLTPPNSFSSRFLVLDWIPAGLIAAVERVQAGSGGKRTSHFAGAALASQSVFVRLLSQWLPGSTGGSRQ